MQISNQKILSIRWYKIVQRKESLLMLNYLIGGMGRKNTKKILKLDCGSDYYFYLDSNIYLSEIDKNRNRVFLIKLIGKKEFETLDRLNSIWLRTGKKLLLLSQKIKNTKITTLTDSQLKEIFISFSKLNFQLSTALVPPLDLGETLEEKIATILQDKLKKINKEKSFQEYYQILTFPRKYNSPALELILFYKIGMLIQAKLKKEIKTGKRLLNFCLSNREIKNKIEKYLNNYSWMGTRWYLGTPWTFVDVVERFKHSTEENFKEKYEEMCKMISSTNKKTNTIFKELSFSSKEKDLIYTAKDYVYMRTYRTDVFNEAGFLVRNLFKEIGSRFGYNFEEVIHLGYEEIFSLFKGAKIDKEIIKKRQKEFGAIHYRGKVYILTQKQLNFLKYRIEKKVILGGNFFKGITGNPGIAKGRAKIIFSKKDLQKFQKGDIIVAPMTTPELVPAMEIASAFVTDEGGILCHAAIVSREMKKPCIIGTKIATKVLKDGDLIEVDANRGVVKILEKKIRKAGESIA